MGFRQCWSVLMFVHPLFRGIVAHGSNKIFSSLPEEPSITRQVESIFIFGMRRGAQVQNVFGNTKGLEHHATLLSGQ